MNRDFNKKCEMMINQLKDSYHIDEVSGLLWIYLNLLLYHNSQNFTWKKEEFLDKIQKLKDFCLYGNLYHMISKTFYEELFDSILSRYSYRNTGAPGIEVVALKKLEELYEATLVTQIRDKNGAYYTPEVVVDYMTGEAIACYFQRQLHISLDRVKELMEGKKENLTLDECALLLDSLDNIKIVDISCGGGVFIRSALKYLRQLYRAVNLYVGKSYDQEETNIKIINNNLYGIDIHRPTVDLCKTLLLMEITKEKTLSLVKLPIRFNIYEGNSLDMINNGDKVLDHNHFDLVIGNPPYVGERGNKDLFDKIKKLSIGKKYYESKMDYFYFFIYKAHDLLKVGGILAFITTNYFVTADGAKRLRQFFYNEFTFEQLINFNELSLFKDAKGQHNLIFIAQKGKQDRGASLAIFRGKNFDFAQLKNLFHSSNSIDDVKVERIESQENLYDHKGHLLIQCSGKDTCLLEKIERVKTHDLWQLCHINQGIVSGADRLTVPWASKLQRKEDIGKGIFVLREEEVKELFLSREEKQYIKPFYKNSHIKKYIVSAASGLSLLYITDENIKNLDRYSNLFRHLVQYKVILEQRREVKKGLRNWYALQWARKNDIFQGRKIVVPQRSKENDFAYVEEEWYASADVYFITPKDEKISLFYLLGILNSSLMFYWLFYRGKRKGDYLELYSTPLKSLPIMYKEDRKIESSLEGIVKELHDALKSESQDDTAMILRQNEIDDIIYDLYGLNQEEKNIIKNFVYDRRLQR